MNANAQILIAESNCIIAEDIDLLVRSWGYSDSKVAKTATQVYRMTNKWQPDLVIIDSKLKDCENILEVTNRITEKKNVAIILLVDGSNVKLERCERLFDFYYVIKKPIDHNELKLILEIALLSKMKSKNKRRIYWSSRNIFQNANKQKQHFEPVSL